MVQSAFHHLLLGTSTAHAVSGETRRRNSAEKLGFEYHSNSHAWMTGEIFQRWLVRWDCQLRRENRRVLLLVDNFAGHKVGDDIVTNIRVVHFAPNLTAHIQPMDGGIIRCFKAHYRRHFLRRARSLFEDGANDIYSINQLQA